MGESQQSSIDHSLSAFRDLFEGELGQITAFMADLKIKQNQNDNILKKERSKSPTIEFDDKPLSPINNRNSVSFHAESLLNAINNDIPSIKQENGDYNKMVEIQCNRLNEMLMSEFVVVLINNLSTTSEYSFNKLFLIIIKIINNLWNLQWQAIKSKFTGNPIDVNHKIQSVFIQYKVEIDNLFVNIFQNTVNNVLKDLINDKMNRIKLQSRIAKLTNKLQKNNEKSTLSKAQHNKIKQEFSKISIKQIDLPFIATIFSLFLWIIYFGYSLFGKQQQTVSSEHPTPSFMGF